MKIITRIFLLFILCIFVGMTSANAAMPCCMKMEKAQEQADMKECHKAAKTDDGQTVKHSDHAKHDKPDCDKCQCSHCMSVSYFHSIDTGYNGLAISSLVPSASAILVAYRPIPLDNPPKLRS